MQEASLVTRVTKPSSKMVTPKMAPLSFVSATGAQATVGKLRTYSFLKRFSADKRGATAIMFAFSIFPVIMLTGSAVDYSRLVTVKARMQTAIDAAALAGARAAQINSGNVQAAAETAATNYFNAVQMPFVASKALSAVAMNTAKTTFTWTATSWVPTPFATIGQMIAPKAADPAAPSACANNWWACQKVVSKASTTVAIGAMNIETSFMLDITGSMAGQDLLDLKSAAKDAVDILIWADQSKYTSRVAIAPFSQEVRLPTASAFTAATGLAPVTSNTQKTFSSRYFWRNVGQHCVVERTGVNKYTDVAPGAGNYLMPAWIAGSQNSSANCVVGAAAQPLTTDKQVLNTLIDGLSANGGTAGHLGTAWAWYMLSPNWNSLWATTNQAAPYDTAYNINTKSGDPIASKLKKVAILMTDGDYNQEYTSAGTMASVTGSTPANDNSSNQAKALCQSMKDKGVEVYTVAFGTGLSSSAQTLLTDCATPDSKNSHFYYASNGAALRAAFRDIALKLATIRVTE